MQKVSKIGLKMATGYKKCIEDRWTVKNLLVSAKGQLSTDRYKCLLQKSEKKKKILSYWSGVFHNVLDANCTIYLIETRIMANIRYFPKSGTTSDVGGIISTTRRKNTYKLVKIEMDNVTWNDINIVKLLLFCWFGAYIFEY